MTFGRALSLVVGVGLTAFGGPPSSAQERPADIILHGGTVYTMQPRRPTAEAVVTRGDRIAYVGDLAAAREYAGEHTRWIDLEGTILIPGLVDAHAHLQGLGKYLAQLKFEKARSKSEIREMVLAAQRRAPAGRWIEGRGWDQNDWDVKAFPTWKDLSGTEANPVYFRRVDGHAAWVNKTALEICDITRDTPDPDGGRIVRDADGEPTGVFVDNAVNLVSERIPDPSPDEVDDWMKAAIAHCNARGLTGIHDAGITEAYLESLIRLDERGELTFRVYCMLSSEDEDLPFLEAQLARGPRVEAGGKVVIRAIKLYADGALGSRGAALLDDYSDDPGNTGILVYSRDKLERLARTAAENGYQVCTHAIGDRGNRVILDVYEEVLSETGAGIDARFRVEHAQIVSIEDMPRFKTLGVIPSMQPTHCTSDMYWAEDRVGRARVKGAYAWRSFLADGNRLPLGSDFPVESADPLWGIYAAVTRQDHDGWPEGGWYPEQRLTVMEAVGGFTTDAAYAGFAEDDLGTVETGKLADFTVLDKDIFEIPPAEILTTPVVYTIVGGQIVYEAEPSGR